MVVKILSTKAFEISKGLQFYSKKNKTIPVIIIVIIALSTTNLNDGSTNAQTTR